MQRSVSHMGNFGTVAIDPAKDKGNTGKNLHLFIESATAPRLASYVIDRSSVSPNSGYHVSQPSSPITGIIKHISYLLFKEFEMVKNFAV